MELIDFSDLQTRANAETADSPADIEDIYRLRLDFRFWDLVCMRDLAVGGKATLDDLHTMIQACGNWLNYHLYSFEFMLDGKMTLAELPMEDDMVFGERRMPAVDPRNITVADAVSEFPSLLYSYDFGDGWEIMVNHLGFVDPDSVKQVSCCLFGKGDWPPDDVGAEDGFMRFLEVLKDPSKAEDEFYLRWIEETYFEKYSLARCNSNLRHWEDFRAMA